MAKRRAKTATVQLKVRMREELRRNLEKAAETRDFSLNAEMVDRLEQSFLAATVEAFWAMTGGDGPKEATQLLTLVAGLIRANRGWKTDPEAQKRLVVAFPLFIKFCVTGTLTDDDLQEATHSKVVWDPYLVEGHAGAAQAWQLTGQVMRDHLQKKDEP